VVRTGHECDAVTKSNERVRQKRHAHDSG
jgi:hypothetical protein